MAKLLFQSEEAVTQFTQRIVLPPNDHAFRVETVEFHAQGGGGAQAIRRNIEASAPANTSEVMRLGDLEMLALHSEQVRTVVLHPRGLVLLSGHAAWVGSVTSGDVVLVLYGDFVRLTMAERAAIARRTGSDD